MAEQFANSWLIRNDLTHQFKVISRALTDKYEPPNSPASSHGVEILAKEFSLDLSSHRSSMLTLQEVNDAKIIIGVTELHVEMILRMFPSSEGKLHSFDSDVSDPWHAPLEEYRACANEMMPLVYQKLNELLL